MSDEGGHSRRLDRLCRRSDRPIYTIRRDGRIVTANPAALAWLERDAGEVIGQIASSDISGLYRGPSPDAPDFPAGPRAGSFAMTPVVIFPPLPSTWSPDGLSDVERSTGEPNPIPDSPTGPTSAEPRTEQSRTGNPSANRTLTGLVPPPDVFDGRPMGFVAYQTAPPHDRHAASPHSDGIDSEHPNVGAHGSGLSPPWRTAWAMPLTSGRASATALVILADQDGTDLTEAVSDVESGSQSLRDVSAATTRTVLIASRVDDASPAPSWLLAGSSDASRRLRACASLVRATEADVLATGPPGSLAEDLLRDLAEGLHTPILVCLASDRLDAASAHAAIGQAANLATELRLRPRRWGVLLVALDDATPATQDAILDAMRSARSTPRVWATARPTEPRPTSTPERPGLRHAWAMRLGVVTLPLTALSERPADVPLLAEAALVAWQAQGLSSAASLSLGLRERFERAAWLGDAAELRATLRAAVKRCDGPVLTEQHLPNVFRDREAAQTHRRAADESIPLTELLEAVEREAIRRALGATGGNRTQAAARLGISRGQILRRIDQWNLGTIAVENQPPSKPDTIAPTGDTDAFRPSPEPATAPATTPAPTTAVPPTLTPAPTATPTTAPTEDDRTAAQARRAARRQSLPPLPPKTSAKSVRPAPAASPVVPRETSSGSATSPSRGTPPADSPSRSEPDQTAADDPMDDTLPPDAFIPIDDDDDPDVP